jgi:hypothetical protein
LGTPLLPFTLRLDSRVFALQAPMKTLQSFRDPSHGLRLPFRGRPSTEPPHRASGYPKPLTLSHAKRLLATPPLRFLPLQRFPAQGSGLNGRACLTRPPAPSGFLNLLTLHSALSLPALFHAGSAHGVRPSELCSSRAAVRCLQRRFPPGVGSPVEPMANSDPHRKSKPAEKRARTSNPHLQGLAPRESPPPSSTV